MSSKKPRVEDSAKPETTPKVTAESVQRQRRHIKELTGEDPLRGGIAN